ncbi:MAG: hypothetical protein U0326_11820 [Polyangiales bacterium]
MAAATTPASRAPLSSTESTSTPFSAVPSQCADDGRESSCARSIARGA